MKVKYVVVNKQKQKRKCLLCYFVCFFISTLSFRILVFNFYNQTGATSGVCCIPASLRSHLTWLLLCMLFVWYGCPIPFSPITLSSPQPWNNKQNITLSWHPGTQSPLPRPDQHTWETPKITLICRHFFLPQQRGYSRTRDLSASSWCSVLLCCVFDYLQSCFISLRNGLLVSVGYVNTWTFIYEHRCWLCKVQAWEQIYAEPKGQVTVLAERERRSMDH